MKLKALMTVAFAMASVVCSDQPPGADSPTDTGSTADIEEVEDPASPLPEPRPPVLSPCPEGWRELPSSGLWEYDICEPWPEGGRAQCDDDFVHFPGEAGCVQLGTPCPSGHWADDLPEDAHVLYVLADAPADGTGTPEAPFSSIAEALAVAEPETIVALGAGTYDEEVVVGAGVTIWGACVRDTIITRTDGTLLDATLTAAGNGVGLRNLQVTGTLRGIRVEEGASLRVEDVLVTDTFDAAIDIQGEAELTGERIVVRNTQLGETLFGFGLLAADGATIELDRAAFESNISIWVQDAETSLSLSRSVIRDTTVPLAPLYDPHIEGTGLYAQNATIEISESVFECNTNKAIVLLGQQATMQLSSSLARRLPLEGDCVNSLGIDWDDGPYGTEDDEIVGSGIRVMVGSSATIARTRIVGSPHIGVTVGPIGDLVMTDVVIEGIGPLEEDSEDLAAGLFLLNGTAVSMKQLDFTEGIQVELNRVLLQDIRGVAFFIYGPNVEVEGTDVIINEVDSVGVRCDGEGNCEEGGFGIGMVITRGSHVTLEQFQISMSRLCGLQISRDGELDLRHGLVIDNLIGVNVQSDDYDYSRLMEDVYYLGNERNLDASGLPIPSPEDFGGL